MIGGGDRSSIFVIFNRNDYNSKFETIFGDHSKFKKKDTTNLLKFKSTN